MSKKLFGFFINLTCADLLITFLLCGHFKNMHFYKNMPTRKSYYSNKCTNWKILLLWHTFTFANMSQKNLNVIIVVEHFILYTMNKEPQGFGGEVLSLWMIADTLSHCWDMSHKATPNNWKEAAVGFAWRNSWNNESVIGPSKNTRTPCQAALTPHSKKGMKTGSMFSTKNDNSWLSAYVEILKK